MARQLLPLALVTSLFAGCAVNQDVVELTEDAALLQAPVPDKNAAVDVSPPPPFELDLVVNNLAIDDFVQMRVTGAEPGDNVIFLRGNGLGEDCPPGFDPLCTDITNPQLAYLGSTAIADEDGMAEKYFLLPANPGLIGQRVYLQAVVYRPDVKESNVFVSDITAGADCDPDLFESNDTFDDAVGISPGSYENLSICSDLEDWYTISVDEGDVLDFDVFFNDDEGDIDIDLYNGLGELIDSSISVDDNESIDYIADIDRTLYMRVYMFRDEGLEQQGNVYDLEVARTPGELSFCEPDGFEDNDTPGEAVNISALITGGNVTDTFPGLTSCEDDGPADLDVYAVDILAGESITVWLEFMHDEGDIDVSLVDLATGDELDFSLSTSDNEFVTHTAAEDQTVLIRVALFSDEGVELVGGNWYDMNVTVGGATPFDARLFGASYDAHDGQTMTVALVDISDGSVVASDSTVVSGGVIDFAFMDVMEPEGSYEWHFYADFDGDGMCDAPPTDHVWLVDAGQAFGNIETEYDHDVDFTDVCATFP